MTKLGRVAKAKPLSQCANSRCPDTGATRVRIERHHTGCERMFVRHLMTTRMAEPWVIALALRYDAFHPDDTVPLCLMCHREMHERYLPYIKLITYTAGVPIAHMSEQQVTHHISMLRKRCARVLDGGFVVRKGIVDDYYSGKDITASGRPNK